MNSLSKDKIKSYKKEIKTNNSLSFKQRKELVEIYKTEQKEIIEKTITFLIAGIYNALFKYFCKCSLGIFREWHNRRKGQRNI